MNSDKKVNILKLVIIVGYGGRVIEKIFIPWYKEEWQRNWFKPCKQIILLHRNYQVQSSRRARDIHFYYAVYFKR